MSNDPECAKTRVLHDIGSRECGIRGDRHGNGSVLRIHEDAIADRWLRDKVCIDSVHVVRKGVVLNRRTRVDERKEPLCIDAVIIGARGVSVAKNAILEN